MQLKFTRGVHVLATAALAIFVLATAPQASAHIRHHCPKGYHRKAVKRQGHRHVHCVKNRRRPAQRQMTLHAHLDPAYTRDPLDPFKVTYDFSASATSSTSTTAQLVEEPAPLPEGVLALYSDGSLECAINVGSQENEGDCPVQYQALGVHRITTVYTSGMLSSTVTETEDIPLIPTNTSLSYSYSPIELTSEKGIGAGGTWLIGTLSITAGVQPQGSANVSWCIPICGGNSEVPNDPGGHPLVRGFSGTIELDVFGRSANRCGPEEPFHEVGIRPEGATASTLWVPAADIEEGSDSLIGWSSVPFGYDQSSTAAMSLQFTLPQRPERTGPGC
jgi:hypothetical protein